MNKKKIEPEFKYFEERLNEVVSDVKQNSLDPIVKIFMETLESHDYTDSQILSAITDYFDLKDSEKYYSLVGQLEKSIQQAKKINGETFLLD